MDNTEFEQFSEKISDEIKTIGATSKENYNTINKDFNDFKKAVEESINNKDPLIAEKMDKLSADILARQEKLDNDLTKRLDSIEVAFQRMPKGSVNGKVSDEMKAAVMFKTAALSNQKKLTSKGVSQDDITLEEYNAYQEALHDVFVYGEKAITPEMHKQLSVGIDSDGGYTVTPFMSNKITERVFEIDPLRELARVETISTDIFEEIVEFDEAGAGWASETVANSATDTPTFRKKQIGAHFLEARPRTTLQLIQDSSRNIESWIANKVGEKFGRTEAAAFVNGDGVDKPRGFLTYSNVSTEGIPEFGKIEQINMGNASTLTTAGLLDVQYGLVEGVMSRATWLANRLTVRDLMKLKDGDGLFIWRPGLIQGQPPTLLGQNIRMSTTMPVVAANALSIAYADWQGAYLIVDRLGTSVVRDPLTVKPLIEFFTRKRVGGDVIGFDKIVIGKVAA